MVDTHVMIGRGYFPEGVPPTFSTITFADHVKSAGLGNVVGTAPGNPWTKPVRHNLARAGGLRRPLEIPNPIGFLKTIQPLCTHWTSSIEPQLAKSKMAASIPKPSIGPRAVERSTQDAPEMRANARSAARYLLIADIQNFYPSIYTHSIPWAMHTKAVAKQNTKDWSLCGNVIDRAIREGQDGQTMGIPIGPDSSWIVAECLLSAIELSLRAKVPNLRGYRYLDDFEIACATLKDAESALVALQETLAEFELTLNPRKTRIHELPMPLEMEGIDELRRWEFRTNPRAERSDVLAYFDRVAELISKSRGTYIASYAVARMRSASISPTSWSLLENQLLQLLLVEPSSARHVAITLSLSAAAGCPLSPNLLTDATEQIVIRHASLGHGSEVAWALWLCLAHGVPLTAASTNAIAGMKDCLVALIALDLHARGLTNGPFDKGKWEILMTASELRGENWLLSYEARHKNWMPSIGAANHIDEDPFFKALAAGNVSFYDPTKLKVDPTMLPLVSSPGGGGGGGGGGY